ncbi:MAG TPA: dihydrodipicolinate synthase family protein [Acidobacteriota bacterium]|nr:dihydrodipicolinate synthase family protein [Acidobacteriota bacterium]
MIENTELETVIAIPPIPFRGGKVAWSAHEKNIDFLIRHNFLSGNRKRAIALGGTSLIHHVTSDEYLKIVDLTGQVTEEKAVFIAGLLPSPASEALVELEKMMNLRRPPDFLLLMPIAGVVNPEGIRRDLGRFIEESSDRFGTRSLVYLRQRSLLDISAQLLNEQAGLEGIKIGTVEEDVAKCLGQVPESKKVLWGVGDRATQAARLGSRGHTSGITLVCPRACDGINNAYREGNFEESSRLEQVIEEFESIRFMEERAYNYSAIVAAAEIAGYEDVELGDVGPFNAEPPEEVMKRLEGVVESLADYH